MKVFVRNLNDRTILLDVASGETVADVKARLQAREGIPTIEQRLLYAGRQLADDQRTLADYGVANESTFSLLLSLKGGFEVFVVESEGKTITIVVEPGDTILNVKAKISERINAGPEEQYLMYNGKPLEDSKTVGNYNIQKDATLWLSIRLLGGGSN